eukprot:gene114-5526_t
MPVTVGLAAFDGLFGFVKLQLVNQGACCNDPATFVSDSCNAGYRFFNRKQSNCPYCADYTVYPPGAPSTPGVPSTPGAPSTPATPPSPAVPSQAKPSRAKRTEPSPTVQQCQAKQNKVKPHGAAVPSQAKGSHTVQQCQAKPSQTLRNIRLLIQQTPDTVRSLLH